MNDNIIILCRHGERIDRTNHRNEQRANKDDPELTQRGNDLAKNIGKKIATKFKSYIDKNDIKLYSSPFTRTLETALSMRNEMQKIITNKDRQELLIVRELGEWNLYKIDIYPTILYYLNGKKQKETKLYEDIILNKTNQSIKYDIKYIDNGEVKYPEKREEADKRYINFLQKILNEIKGTTGNLVILVSHGEFVSACCRYLCSLIKKQIEKNIKIKDIKNLWPDFLNIITGDNQKYCNSFCFKFDKNGNVSFYDTILPDENI